MAKQKTLNVKRTNRDEISKQWGFEYYGSTVEPLFIRCNAKGAVNWEVAPIYRLSQLIKRGKYNIILKK